MHPALVLRRSVERQPDRDAVHLGEIAGLLGGRAGVGEQSRVRIEASTLRRAAFGRPEAHETGGAPGRGQRGVERETAAT